MSSAEGRSGSNAGVVILVVCLLLGLPCLAGVGLLLAGMFFAWSEASPAPMSAPTMMVEPSELVAPAEQVGPKASSLPGLGEPIGVEAVPQGSGPEQPNP